MVFTVQSHYKGNKSRNAQVREDIPTAKTEQRKEEEEAAYIKAMYEQMLREQWVHSFSHAFYLIRALHVYYVHKRQSLQTAGRILLHNMFG